MPPPQRGPRPAPATDIDRFLQEVDRLRRKAADEAQKPPPAPQPRQDARFDEVLEVLPAEPKPPPVARPRRPRRFDDVEVVPTARPAPPAPAPLRPVASAPAASTSTAFPTTGVESIATVAKIATIATISRPSAPQAAGQGKKAPSADTAEILTLLRRGNLRTAVLLREILDAPLSRRRRR